MSGSNLKPGNNAIGKNRADWDVNIITEQILTELNGAASCSTIQEVLSEVLPRYENARIQTFVPIFVRRDVVERLRAIQASFASSIFNETHEAPEGGTSSNPTPRGIAIDEEDETNEAALIHRNPAT